MSTPEHYSISVYSAKDIAVRYERNHFSDEIGQYIHEKDISAIAHATPSRPEVVADIGTGTGRIASGLRQGDIGLHPRIIGIDTSSAMLSAAARKDPMIQLLRANAHTLPLPDRLADLTVCFRVLMHSPDPVRLIGELARISRGVVILDFPSTRSVAWLHSCLRRIRAHFRKDTQTFRTFTFEQVEEIFACSGFSVRAISGRFVLPVFFHRLLARFLGIKSAIAMDLFFQRHLGQFSSSITLIAERCSWSSLVMHPGAGPAAV